MKKTFYFMFAMSLFSIATLLGQEKTEEFTVKGGCGMCKSHIENAAMSVEGVTKAEWNLQEEVLKITYDSSLSDIDKVHKAVAQAGYDTDKYKADDKVYDTLPGCCKYERKS